jgi:hypothetical protein
MWCFPNCRWHRKPPHPKSDDTTVASSVRRRYHSICVAGAIRRGPPAITSCCAFKRSACGTAGKPRMRHPVGSPTHRRCRLHGRFGQWRQNESASQYSRCVAMCAASTSVLPSSKLRRFRKFGWFGRLLCDVGMIVFSVSAAPSPRTREEVKGNQFSRRVFVCARAMPRQFQERSVARMERSEIRGRPTSLNAGPGLRCASSGLRTKWKRNADKRIVHLPHASGVRRALKRSALACRRSTTALAAASERHSSAPATRFLGLGRGAPSRWFERSCAVQRALPAPSCPSPASCLADRSSCRLGVLTRSRPEAEVTSPHPREPFSLRQPASPAAVL